MDYESKEFTELLEAWNARSVLAYYELVILCEYFERELKRMGDKKV